MLIRTYFDKQATLISDNNTNNSKNPVLEIVRGEDLYSRYIFNIDLIKLKNKLNDYGVSENNIISHKIVFYNTIRFRDDLIGKKNIDGFSRDNNIELKLFAFNEDFSDGVKFDYEYTKNSIPNNTYVPNWFYKTKNELWDVPGIYSGNTANIIETIGINDGSDNINFNITTHLNNILYTLSGESLNLGLAYGNEYEYSVSGDNKFIISFFSKETQTFFEPFLETIIDDVIIDNRNEFYMDQDNNLFFYTKKELDSVDFVDIIDDMDNIYRTYTSSEITKINKFTYKINLNVDSDLYPDMINFIDKWTYTLNNKQYTFDNNFTLLKENIFSTEETAFMNSEYFIGTIGLYDNEKISRSVKTKKVQLTTKRLFNSSIENEVIVDFIEYRLFIKQGQTQIEIIPYTNVNKTFYSNYFVLDIESLIPQTYYIEFRLRQNGNIININKPIKFTIISEKD